MIRRLRGNKNELEDFGGSGAKLEGSAPKEKEKTGALWTGGARDADRGTHMQ